MVGKAASLGLKILGSALLAVCASVPAVATAQQNYGTTGLYFYPETQPGDSHGSQLFSQLSAATGNLKTISIAPYKHTRIVVPKGLKPGTVIGNVDGTLKLRVPRRGMSKRSRLIDSPFIRVTLVARGKKRGLRIVTSGELTLNVTLRYNILRGTACKGAMLRARATAVGTRGSMVRSMPINPCFESNLPPVP
jgi:hypothetical protein